jgi:beta-lactamase superfamily II metal-dependent hydrolase
VLSIHTINVNQGDSIVIQYDGPSGKVFAVIDSNRITGSPPAALTKLQELGAESLSFLALTHPHADHYSGLSDILSFYNDKINTFYCFPLGAHLSNDRLKKYAAIYQELAEKADPSVRGKIVELIRILSLVKTHIGMEKWEEPPGCFTRIAPIGFEGVEIYMLLPPARIKGPYFEMIERGCLDEITTEKNINHLSLAFCLRYRGKEIILGGDGSADIWREQQRFCERSEVSIGAHAVKLPHHGSDKDNSDVVLNHLFGNHDNEIAIISANGNTHPASSTLQRLGEKSIKPYCTNLSRKCTPLRRLDVDSLKGIDPKLARFLISSKTNHQSIQPCQGDITLQIDSQGNLTVLRQYENACVYRNDFGFLAASGAHS